MELDKVFFNTTDFKLDTSLQNVLGKGAFGTVYIITSQKDNSKYAIKIIYPDSNFNGHEQMLFMRESLILQKLNHPAIVKFIGINFQSFHDTSIFQPSIITEYLPRGSLDSILKKEQSGEAYAQWNPTRKYINMLGIVHAMRYLHAKGVIHRDLKPQNILVDDDLNPHLCDFGLSRCFAESLTKSVKLVMTGNIGTPMYMAPEIIQGDELYGASVDVFAFGIIALEIVSGKQPYSELGKSINAYSLGVKVVNGYRPKINESVTEKMKSLILKCLSQNPDERPSFDEIFKLLSSDFRYINEKVDENEINDYIRKLESSVEKSECVEDVKEECSFEKRKEEEKLQKDKENYSKVIVALSEKVDNLEEVEIDGVLKKTIFVNQYFIWLVK